MINPIVSLLVIPFLTNNMGKQSFQGFQNYTGPNIQNLKEIIDLLERINYVSNNMNRSNNRNGGRINGYNKDLKRNESYDGDIISRLKDFLIKLNGE